MYRPIILYKCLCSIAGFETFLLVINKSSTFVKGVLKLLRLILGIFTKKFDFGGSSISFSLEIQIV